MRAGGAPPSPPDRPLLGSAPPCLGIPPAPSLPSSFCRCPWPQASCSRTLGRATGGAHCASPRGRSGDHLPKGGGGGGRLWRAAPSPPPLLLLVPPTDPVKHTVGRAFGGAPCVSRGRSGDHLPKGGGGGGRAPPTCRECSTGASVGRTPRRLWCDTLGWCPLPSPPWSLGVSQAALSGVASEAPPLGVAGGLPATPPLFSVPPLSSPSLAPRVFPRD